MLTPYSPRHPASPSTTVLGSDWFDATCRRAQRRRRCGGGCNRGNHPPDHQSPLVSARFSLPSLILLTRATCICFRPVLGAWDHCNHGKSTRLLFRPSHSGGLQLWELSPNHQSRCSGSGPYLCFSPPSFILLTRATHICFRRVFGAWEPS